MIATILKDEVPAYYIWKRVPRDHRTKKQWLKRHRRLKKDAPAVGTITLIFDRPWDRPRSVDPIPAEECQRLRSKLKLSAPDPADHFDFQRLDEAGQLSVMNLYDIKDTEEITCFTEA